MKRDMSRTIAAIAAYDKFNDAFDAGSTTESALAAFAELERLERAVGRAYGLDTSDINSLYTCERIIKPGPKVPGAGFALSFVRRMAAQL
jgi:hypothetical protein